MFICAKQILVLFGSKSPRQHNYEVLSKFTKEFRSSCHL